MSRRFHLGTIWGHRKAGVAVTLQSVVGDPHRELDTCYGARFRVAKRAQIDAELQRRIQRDYLALIAFATS